MNELNSIGAANDKATLLGAVKKLFMDAMEDANFHREKDACATAIKGNIGSVPVIVDGLGKMVVNIGATRIKAALEEHYSRISNAAGWSGQAIAEGTALFLEQIGFEKMGQDLLDKFNAQFEGEAVRVDASAKLYESLVAIEEKENVLCEAEVEMDAMNPDDKDFLKFLKKHKVEIIDKRMDGPAGGHPVILMQGKRKDLEKVLADCDYGWCDEELAEYIYESKVNEAEVKSDEDFKEYAFSVLQKAFGEDFDEAKAQEVVDGLISKHDGDYGAMVGALQSSLG